MEDAEETVEIKAGELLLNVPYTRAGLEVVRAMVTLLEAEIDTPEEEKPPSFFMPAFSSPKQRIKFKNWEAIAKTKMGTIYQEVIDRMLEEYKDGVEPKHETLSSIIREMYGKHLKENSIAVYVSVYLRYIRENKLAIKHPQETFKQKETFKPKTKCLLPIDKVIEIWNLLPDNFEYKQVKALVPAHIMQSAPRVETTNYIIKQFLDNPAFWCEETSAGVFVKVKTEEGESF